MKGETTMSCEDNKALVQRFVDEFWSHGNLAAADDLMTADALIVLPGRGQVSKDEFKEFNTIIRKAFPDWYSDLAEMIAEDDRVGERWTGRGTHKGEFQGVAATGRQVAVPGFVFYRIDRGKIAEFRGMFDGFSMLQQIGAALVLQQSRA
jgi:steroid delta-isomerase-like uncharacterized protein